MQTTAIHKARMSRFMGVFLNKRSSDRRFQKWESVVFFAPSPPLGSLLNQWLSKILPAKSSKIRSYKQSGINKGVRRSKCGRNATVLREAHCTIQLTPLHFVIKEPNSQPGAANSASADRQQPTQHASWGASLGAGKQKVIVPITLVTGFPKLGQSSLRSRHFSC